MAKPLNFRPTDDDEYVLNVIREDNPFLATSDAAVIRLALSAYMKQRTVDVVDLLELVRKQQHQIAELERRIDEAGIP